jgi:hypothetical protein
VTARKLRKWRDAGRGDHWHVLVRGVVVGDVGGGWREELERTCWTATAVGGAELGATFRGRASAVQRLVDHADLHFPGMAGERDADGELSGAPREPLCLGCSTPAARRWVRVGECAVASAQMVDSGQDRGEEGG